MHLSAQLENPWNEFDPEGEGVTEYYAAVDGVKLPALRKACEKEEKYKLHFELLPEPFVGDPTRAAFVVLTTNPGFSEPAGETSAPIKASDKESFTDPVIENIILHNLRNENDREMYWANPRCRTAICEDGKRRLTSPYVWYFGREDAELAQKYGYPGETGKSPRLAYLHQALSYLGPLEDLKNASESAANPKDFAKNIDKKDKSAWDSERGFDLIRTHVAIVDLIPYHSVEASPSINYDLPTKEYTRELVLQALNNKAYIMIGRRHEGWSRLVPELFDAEKNHGRVFTCGSGQNVSFTPNNTYKMDKGIVKEKDPEFFWQTVQHILET